MCVNQQLEQMWDFKCFLVENPKPNKTMDKGSLGVSTDRSGSDLCPTCNWPDDIGFPARKPTADRENQQVRSNWIGLIYSWIDWSCQRCCRRFLLGGNLYFSPNLRWIYAKLTRFEKKKSNHRWICAKLTRSKQKKKIKSSSDLSKTQHIFTESEL